MTKAVFLASFGKMSSRVSLEIAFSFFLFVGHNRHSSIRHWARAPSETVEGEGDNYEKRTFLLFAARTAPFTAVHVIFVSISTANNN